MVFLAPPRPEALLRDRFEAAVAAERAQGNVPELDAIALVASPAELAALDGPHADYLEPLVRRHTQAGFRRDS